jgi:hypothetical protein
MVRFAPLSETHKSLFWLEDIVNFDGKSISSSVSLTLRVSSDSKNINAMKPMSAAERLQSLLVPAALASPTAPAQSKELVGSIEKGMQEFDEFIRTASPTRHPGM